MFRYLKIFLLTGLISLTVQGSETAEGLKKDMDQVRIELSVKLEAAKKQLKELRKKAEEKGDAAALETSKELEKSHNELKREVDLLKTETKKNWKTFKKNLSESVDELNTKIQKSLKE